MHKTPIISGMQVTYQRNIAERAAGALERFPIVAIQGARRVGKSTLAASLVANRPHVLVTLDDSEQLDLAVHDPKGFLMQGGDAVMVIDEVQRAPDLLLAIKASVDADTRPGRYVLTGSSDFTTLAKVPDSLAGRAITIQLGGLSQGELMGLREDFCTTMLDDPATLAQDSQWTRADYIAAVTAGGYPELRFLEEPWRTLWADSYIDRLTSRDIADVAGRLPGARVRAVLGMLAANQSGELVKARLADLAQIPERSITRCVEALEALYVIARLQPWTANLTKRQVGRTKAIILDSGLATHLVGATASWLTQPAGSKTLGMIVEGFVDAELLKQQSWSSQRWQLEHFRDRAGLEVDSVIRLADGRVILIEVKASHTYRREHMSAITALADQLGDHLAAGVVLTLSEHAWRFGDKLWGLPISALWGHARPVDEEQTAPD